MKYVGHFDTSPVWVITSQLTADEVQAVIDADELGHLVVTIPWVAAAAFDGIASGDDAVVETAAEGDATSWIATVLDVEGGEGYPLTVLLDIR